MREKKSQSLGSGSVDNENALLEDDQKFQKGPMRIVLNQRDQIREQSREKALPTLRDSAFEDLKPRGLIGRIRSKTVSVSLSSASESSTG